MDIRRLLSIQAERGAKAIGTEHMFKSIEFVIAECRRYIQERSETYRDLEPEAKRQAIKELIISYVMSHPHLVEGYVDEDNRPDTNKLVDRLIEDITDYGILTAAMLDPDIYEIRANGKEIKVEKKGRCIDLTDKEGRILSFDSVEQQDIILRKLLGDVRLTPKDAIVNARTVEGYRVAAVHSSALSPDPEDPSNSGYHAFVLRKFRKLKMELPDLIKHGTLSDNMGRFLALLPEGGLTFVTVGPTASGKTTTNNAILQATPPDIRTIVVQNPSEIDLRKRDATGRVYNDVLHIETKEKENPSPTDNTMENVQNHILRLSPTLVCFGELRANIEFKNGLIIMQAGHPINATYHADDSEGAIQRYMTAYLAESGNQPSELVLAELTDKINIVIVQMLMRDGTRKIVQISEIIGVDSNNPNKAIVNDLFIYEMADEHEYDEYGKVVNIRGRHKRVGQLSERTIMKLKYRAISKSQYDFLLKPPSDDEIETYTGENIINYGKKIRGAQE